MTLRLLTFGNARSGPARLTTERLLLRRPEGRDFEAWADLRAVSRAQLEPFEPSWTRDELSRGAFRARLRAHEADVNAGRGLPWFVFHRDGRKEGRLMGGLALSNIRRGVCQTATLGYWLGTPFTGHGFMREAVRTVVESGFAEHRLNRIEAGTVPENERSQRLLTACGFQREGTARGYLRIAGAWRDHVIFARLGTDACLAVSEHADAAE